MLNILKQLTKSWDFGETRTALAALCAHSVSISIGLCQGYSAILIPQLMLSPNLIAINSEQASWIASLGAVSNPIGSIVSGLLAEWLGRRRSMQISSGPFIIGWITIATATSINGLYVGRFVTGIAAGMSTACYAYVTEISTPSNRGLYQALGPICASLGILVTYCAGYLVPWQFVAYGSVLFALVSLIGAQFVPESPPWLYENNRPEESLESLVWLRRNVQLAQNEMSEFTQQQLNGLVIKLSLMVKASTLKPCLILGVLFLCQELSGIYTILFYTVSFFKDSNLSVNEYHASIIVGAIRFTMSIVAAFLIKRYTRKRLCLISATGMSVTMFITACYIKYYEVNPVTRTFQMLPLVFVLLNVLFSMIGMLPIPWVMVGELFPLEVRAIMSGLVVCFAQFVIFLCVKIHINIVEQLHFSGALFIFTTASILTMFYVKYMLPETKDKTLNEIQQYFQCEKQNNKTHKLCNNNC